MFNITSKSCFAFCSDFVFLISLVSFFFGFFFLLLFLICFSVFFQIPFFVVFFLGIWTPARQMPHPMSCRDVTEKPGLQALNYVQMWDGPCKLPWKDQQFQRLPSWRGKICFYFFKSLPAYLINDAAVLAKTAHSWYVWKHAGFSNAVVQV